MHFKLILYVCACISVCVKYINGEDVTLVCDEFERVYDNVAGEFFCTISGFTVSHNQDVKIQRYSRANLTKFMKFYDSRLLYMPFKLFDVFTNLKTLDVSFTEIIDVSRNTFSGANNLTYLNMSNNNLTQLTTSVFVGANNLRRLDLSRNQISDINELAFQGLKSLDKLQLSYNRLKIIHKDIFKDNNYIETIALDNNQIEFIQPEIFNYLRHIRDINLSYNKINTIDPYTFAAAYTLESLILSSNLLNEFQLMDKSILTQLQIDYNNLTNICINGTKFVRADHNRITNIQMVNSVYLESLELSTNFISDISNITNHTSLLQLDLSYNPIGPLNITTFARMKRLRSLYLRSTGIRRLSFGMFSKQINLEILDISFNNLTTLNLDIFIPYLSNLKQLYIDGNNLTEIQGKRSFSFAFQNLQTLGISKNRFNCSYLHSILLPPNLSSSVTLHVEPETSIEESLHIRDVTCSSDIKDTLIVTQAELHNKTELQSRMQQSLDMLLVHQKQLELYLLLLKVALAILLCLMIGCLIVLAHRSWTYRRGERFLRRGGSIVFHSNATTDLEH